MSDDYEAWLSQFVPARARISKRDVVIAIVIAAGIIITAIAMARAGEITLQGPYEVSAFRRGDTYSLDRPTVWRAAGPFESREVCKHALPFVRVEEPGVRLICTPVESTTVR